jgi:hypothetical protein
MKQTEILLSMAGSDTTAIALRSIIYHLIKTPRVYRKLQDEIDEFDREGLLSPIIQYHESIKMPYLYVRPVLALLNICTIFRLALKGIRNPTLFLLPLIILVITQPSRHQRIPPHTPIRWIPTRAGGTRRRRHAMWHPRPRRHYRRHERICPVQEHGRLWARRRCVPAGALDRGLE